MNLKQYIPGLSWILKYPKKYLSGDVIAGLTVWVMLVPQGMAYALLAGVPPIYGLYSSVIPPLLFMIFGTSRHLSIGPVAISALLVLAGISQIAEPMSDAYIGYVVLTGLLIGLFQILASFVRLGFLVNFLSHPVIAGFTSAAAIIIAASQLKYLLGIDIPRYSFCGDSILHTVHHIDEVHLPTLLLSTLGFIIILVLKKVNKKIPGALLVVIISIAAVGLMQLNNQGINIVGVVPKGLPSFVMPDITFVNIKLVMPTVLTVTLIGIVESIGIAKVYQGKHRNYKINANKEFFALGISKIAGSFFQSIPTSGSFTRTAVNSDSGANTQLSGVVTSVLIGLTLLFLTPLFYYLPYAILASIILVSVLGLFEWKEAIKLWKTHKADFAMMAITFVATLLLGIESGVLIGVILSVLMVMYRSAKPHIAVLGRIPDTNFYRDITRFPDSIQLPDCIILRFDSQLFFANSEYFAEAIENLVDENKSLINTIILDGSNINDIDSSGLHTLETVCESLHEQHIEFYLAGIIGPVRDRLHMSGLMSLIGKENQFMYVTDAVDGFTKRKGDQEDDWSDHAVQTNRG